LHTSSPSASGLIARKQTPRSRGAQQEKSPGRGEGGGRVARVEFFEAALHYRASVDTSHGT
jgi:hypothetical protein